MDFNKDIVHSIRVRGGKKRTYFFDIKQTSRQDYYLTLTESVKREEVGPSNRHKIFIFKEDIKKFKDAIDESFDKLVELMPDFDFEAFPNSQHDDAEDFA